MKPKCAKCGGGNTFHFPDSLADGCADCGAVMVMGKPSDVTVGSWLQDTAGPPGRVATADRIRRCSKCGRAMSHTRLKGYRCATCD